MCGQISLLHWQWQRESTESPFEAKIHLSTVWWGFIPDKENAADKENIGHVLVSFS